MRKTCTTLLSGTGSACAIIPVRTDRSGAKSKGALLVLATVLMVAALAGCSGNNKTTTPLMTGMPITGLDNLMLTPRTFTIPAGRSEPIGQADGMRTVLSCPEGGEDCVVTITEDGTAQYTGGAPTVTTYTALYLPSGAALTEGTIPAGVSLTVRDAEGIRIVVTCPADGEDCEVILGEINFESTGGTPRVVTYTTLSLSKALVEGATIPAGGVRRVQNDDGSSTEFTCPAGGLACVVVLTEDGTAQYTGGMPTFIIYTPLTGLPEGHTLAEGTIPAGTSQPIRYSLGEFHDVACPAGGPDCEITRDFEYTSGEPTVVTRYNLMVWQANNGPAGTSDGAHATGFRGLLQAGTNFGTVVTFGGGRLGNFYHEQTLPSGTARTATPTASWANGATAPTLGLSLSGTGTGSYSVVSNSEIPSLAGWNGVALSKTLTTPARTARAVLYSDITEMPSMGSADGSYLTFGVWMDIPDASTAGSGNFLFGTFTGGPVGRRVPLTGGAGRVNMSGTASYAGVATGVYSKATYTGMGSSRALASTRIGSFTATATLSADFAAAGSFTGIGGSITNFKENGESLGAWHVGLQTASASNSGTPELINGNFIGSGNGRARIGPAATDYLSGAWNAIFYRGDGESGTTIPQYVTGTFRANTGAENNDSLILLGVYAAERQ